MRAKRDDSRSDVEWKEWSEESFEEARRQGKLVLLDLTASWCHWCHVMDEKTYSNPDIASAINDDFIPIRVDIDRRPDISERYNRGGFPTTAFLSDQGESIWGATFVPPADMKRIMEAILGAKGSGEIDKALERSRLQSLDAAGCSRLKKPVDSSQLSSIFEDVFAAYDVQFGGFGIEPKFPHPDVTELLLIKYVETKEDGMLEAALNTIERMASGLHDEVEGGVFRYSVTRDWKTPHYEKMLETNVGFLRNLVHAHGIVNNRGFDLLARDIAKYLVATLQDVKSGGFYGSQDADEEYYKLGASMRKRRSMPSVDKTVYAGWNADASAVFTLAGIVLGDDGMLGAGETSWDYILRYLWNQKIGLVKHVASEETYLFEDQVSFLKALLAQLGVSKDDSKVNLAEQLIRGVDKVFASGDGGFNDIIESGKAIGELNTPRRPLAQNSDWALELARFGTAVHRQELVGKALDILNSFTLTEIEAHGVFAAAYLRARWALDRGMSVIEIHEKASAKPTENKFLASVQALFDPSIISITTVDRDLTEPYSLVCTDKGCSQKMSEPEELLMFLKNRNSNRSSSSMTIKNRADSAGLE